MRNVNSENLTLSEKFNLDFCPTEMKLGRWGEIDFYCKENEVLVLLEIEKGQKHPNTNVLKVWPFLEENPEMKILLIQIIRKENKAPNNRITLCQFTGAKLEYLFPKRFRYVHFNLKVQKNPNFENILQMKL